MNVLMVYPKLPVSFWSVEKLCRIRGEKAVQPPLSLLTVAALLPREWSIRLVDMNIRPVSESDWEWADLVMISAMFSQRSGVREVVSEARRRSKKTIAGGAYPTLLPEELLDAGCNYVVRGEAENTISLLLKAIAGENSPKIIESAAKPNLADSPVPRYDLVKPGDYAIMSIQTSRGCPHNCEFCDIVEMFGRSPRYKEPGQIAVELDTLRETGFAGSVFVCDDNFIGNRDRAKNILERMIAWNNAHGNPFSYLTQVSMNLGHDIELIDMMTAANFGDLLIGLETPDLRVLKGIGKTQNARESMVDAVNNIKKNGLTVMASFIVGFDHEDEHVAEQICSLVEQTDIPIVVPNMLLAIPKTQLWKRLEREGRLINVRDLPELTFTEINFKTMRPHAKIIKDYRDIWTRLYEPSRYLARTYGYYTAMRPTRRALAIAKGERPPPERNVARKLSMNTFRDIKSLLFILWELGIVSACRGQFWRQILGMMRNNPSRLRLYLDKCAYGLWLAEMRNLVSSRADIMTTKCRAGSGSSTSAA
ncbi:MAG: radical SAM protein [Kiritimatiellae bacterium]|nr:radical SAM protein [Kiritimatiellia bacterium]